jgi:hypothetical protein
MCRIWLALLPLAVLCAAPPNPKDIVARSVANTQADWRVAPQYDFTERDATTPDGRNTSKYRVMMIDGSPYDELIAENGEPLPKPEAAAEARKLRRETARRQHETPYQRRKRVAEYDRERRQDNALLKTMIDGFNYRLAGEATIDGRRCYVLKGTPKPGFQPTSRETEVLKGMRGTMWIDEQQYQWAKVEAEVFRPVTFGLFIARVRPGTEFTLEQRPVGGNLWLPSHFSMRVKATVLHFWAHNSFDDETYRDYHKASPGAPTATASRP